ncbi:MAG: hypothetical protein IJY81_04515 [Lachnospiraceae bacterium]|nr:hypothetical protein [Lachnospiraceae bacterium]
MPLPVWLLPVALKGAAIVAGAAGVGTAVHGAAKMKEANDTMVSAKERHEKNMKRFEKENKKTSTDMDKLGKLELEILHSFSEFSDVFEQIKNRPVFEAYSKNGITLPKYDGETLKEVSVGAGVLLGGLGGAGLGAAGGFAAAGATTAAVMALGTASTGTAIASLSGAALTNATLAALGGGAIAAGGGGIAAGTAVLGAATLGVGLLIGGVIFNFTGGKLSDKADEAWEQMKKAEKQINDICIYLNNLKDTANKYYQTLSSVNEIYRKHLNGLTSIVSLLGHKDWNTFTAEEKKVTENTVLLVGLLYNMCKIELVLKSEKEDEMNQINTEAVESSISNAETILKDRF